MTKVEITAVQNFSSTTDKTFSKNQENKVVIGTEDKSIGVLKNGEMIEILQKMLMTKFDSNSGYLKIPIDSEVGSELIVQWGRVDAPAAASTNFDFNISFVDAPYIVMGSLTFTSTDTTIVKVDKVSNSQFKVRNTDPTTTARVFWFAIGV